ncbi:transcription termination/antitermination NusG family protein [Desulfotignum balticum]|jgi:transcriptional antiterminator NusG|uniref:transcription termination/antitermination NusG family protein n=1 Tax=Desulfotignum balticum TaxID=115781 RepID=UPI0004102796|nr:transcription termination/antitermination NusG family protein [Desulfotignum balticum]
MLEKKVTRTSGLKIDHSPTDYHNWYAIQTTTGYEKKLVSTLKALLTEIQLYLPSRKVIHKLKGIQHVKELPLFPGYIFLYKEIAKSLKALDKAESRLIANPVKANGKYLEANKEEMRFLFEIAGKDGVIELSKGMVTEGEEIQIINGPLKQLKGRILFIDTRKNKAKVRIKFMNRLIDVSLGLEIISRSLPNVQ